MLILGVDLETTGLSAADNDIIEVGAVLYDTDSKQPIRVFMAFVSGVTIAPPGPDNGYCDIADLTGLTNEFLNKWGSPLSTAIKSLNLLASHADYWMAHNAPFDRSFYEAACAKLEIDAIKKPWIDTMTDIKWKRDQDGRGGLTTICANHEFLNPYPHRAAFDVLAMLKLVGKYDIDAIIARSKEPTLRVISKAPFDQNHIVKQHRFYWEPDRKHWYKDIKQSDYKADQFPFATTFGVPQ